MNRAIRKVYLAAVIASLHCSPAIASPTPPPEDEQDQGLSDIIVTAMKVRQGGAQDIAHFRSIADTVGMPRPESLTVEGLMGEYDLTLPASEKCVQLFCLTSETMPAYLPTRPGDSYFVGLGFTSNIDEKRWQREPLNLVAVVDKSGSMFGQPLDLVRQSLRKIVGQMKRGDQLSIVLYGDRSHLYMPALQIGPDTDQILAAIARIESQGSTNMEAGLQVGYQQAFETAPGFKGSTRVMLFTDEQPNVGSTDAGSFIGMAEAASQRGIGLTTIGVGIQFDGALATKVSSARGGNLFFIASNEEVKSVFEKNLDTMVSELAHDLKLVLKPHEGYRISGVYGVPSEVMTSAPEGAVEIRVPTVFLSTNGGGIFASIARSSDRADLPLMPVVGDSALLAVDLSYVSATGAAPGASRITVRGAGPAPSEPLRQAQLLVDEYLTLKEATIAFHEKGDPKRAYSLLSGLAGRLKTAPDGMAKEQKLAGQMLEQAAFYSGYAGEAPKTLRHLTVVGHWQVDRAEGFIDIRRGDHMVFSSDRALTTTRRKPGKFEAEETEGYQINESQLFLPQTNLVLDYSSRGDRLILTSEDREARIVLTRVSAMP